MQEVASARIKAFGPSPKADSVPPDDFLEIPASELQGLLSEMVCTYNEIADTLKEAGIRGRDLARLTVKANESLVAARSPIEKGLLLCAFTRQLLSRLREALKSRPTSEKGPIIQVCSKIMSRAIKIIDHIKAVARDDPKRKEIALDSSHARVLFSGADGEQVSRKEIIRSMKRAERLWPALLCSHRPGDGRKTTRITARAEDVAFAPEIDYSYAWQRCGKSIGLCL